MDWRDWELFCEVVEHGGFSAAARALGHPKSSLSAAVQRLENGSTIATFNTFTTEQMDLALGRANVVHAVLLASPESKTFVARARLLDHFRSGDGILRKRPASGGQAKE